MRISKTRKIYVNKIAGQVGKVAPGLVSSGSNLRPGLLTFAKSLLLLRLLPFLIFL